MKQVFLFLTRHQAFPVFMLLAGKNATGKTLFTTLQYLTKNFIYYIASAITLERFHILLHSYAVSFAKKTPRFYETIFCFKN